MEKLRKYGFCDKCDKQPVAGEKDKLMDIYDAGVRCCDNGDMGEKHKCINKCIKREDCGGAHCKCMNLNGHCTNHHYSDCIPRLSPTPQGLQAILDSFDEQFTKKNGLHVEPSWIDAGGTVGPVKDFIAQAYKAGGDDREREIKTNK